WPQLSRRLAASTACSVGCKHVAVLASNCCCRRRLSACRAACARRLSAALRPSRRGGVSRAAQSHRVTWRAMTVAKRDIAMLLVAAKLTACGAAPDPSADAAARDERLARIHASYVFADIHAHPSRFHRANVDRIDADELERYRRGSIDLIVANVSSDAAFHGGYTNRDGTTVPRLRGDDVYPLKPGEGFSFMLDRLGRITNTVSTGDAVLAVSPEAVMEAKRDGKIAIMAALEGVDGVEGSLDNLREIHRRGVRLVQLIHFLNNSVGHKQTEPYIDEGLTDFGRAFVREANRLG